jgi:16S rRNA C1402 (ribose-2'-O) methylase RsmI
VPLGFKKEGVISVAIAMLETVNQTENTFAQIESVLADSRTFVGRKVTKRIAFSLMMFMQIIIPCE